MAAQTLDSSATGFLSMLKELYPAGVPQDVAEHNLPFLQDIPKTDDFEGKQIDIPVKYVYPQGRSATFATAKTNARSSKQVNFLLTQKEDIAINYIDALTMRRSRSNRGAFVQARKTEVDGMLAQLGRSAAQALFGDGGGSIGRVAAGFAASFVQLTLKSDVVNFERGQIVQFGPNADGSALRDAGDFLEIASVDRNLNGSQVAQINFTAAVAGIAGLATNDYIFVQGDAGLKIQGLAGWLGDPAVTPSATLFNAVDRSQDPERLGGVRRNAAGDGIKANILNLVEDIAVLGGRPDTVVIGASRWNDLAMEIDTKVMYSDSTSARVGRKKVTFSTDLADATVYTDPRCPSNRVYVLTMDTWKLHHLDGFPHIVMDDGLTAARDPNANGIEVRARYWANLACVAPGWNGVAAI